MSINDLLLQLILLAISIYLVVIHTADTEYKIAETSEDYKLYFNFY